MKRFLLFILAIIYLGLSIGAAVDMHFCMGKYVGSSFLQSNSSDLCSKCGMQKKASKNKCCKDQHKLVKIEQDQKITAATSHDFLLNAIEIVPNSFQIPTAFISSLLKEPAQANAPPQALHSPIYIRNCHFRI